MTDEGFEALKREFYGETVARPEKEPDPRFT